MNDRIPTVTIIIPHFNGLDVLRRCLIALRSTDYKDYDILVIDNGSTDNSIDMVRHEFPEVIIVSSPRNLGFAAGCNLGIQSTESPFVLLLNNDTVVSHNWLTLMVDMIHSDSRVAAVQPKMLSIRDHKRFDYCGASGGEIDIFGYPFAWGRLFDTMEIDRGQYQQKKDIFWATGAALLLRRSALQKIGLLEEVFFAHMEEIDLQWRMHWAGYHIRICHDAIVYHETGATLGEGRFKKMVLNHRNNLLMILRNHSSPALIWIFPLRILLELLTILGFVLLGKPKRSIAVMFGFFGVFLKWKCIINGRRKIQAIQCVDETRIMHRMYRGSVAFAYYLRGVRYAKDL